MAAGERSGRLAGKVCVVTGATNGIGACVARRFVREGARVAAVGRDQARGQALVDELGAGSVAFVRLDLTDDGAADACIGEAVERLGPIDVLVNNAALDHSAPLLDVPVADVRQVLETNLVAPLLLLQAAARQMRGRGGAIVNVVSRLAVIGNPGMGVYGSSKGGLLSLTRHAALELAPLDIRVNAVAPGLTETPLMAAWLEQSDDAAATRARALSGIPQGRFGRPEDVANAILFLASDEAAHVTGASLAVDGGYTAA